MRLNALLVYPAPTEAGLLRMITCCCRLLQTFGNTYILYMKIKFFASHNFYIFLVNL